MRHKKGLKAVIILLILIVGTPLCLYIAGCYYFSDARIYEQNWGIVIPVDAKVEYNQKTPADFHGDGFRYTIFQFKPEGASVLKGTSTEKNADMETAVVEILKNLGVDEKRWPDFSNTYKWKILHNYDNKLYIIEDKKSSRVYFIQETM